MSQLRGRLGSIGDSAPPSESSEGTSSETCCYISQDWNEIEQQQKRQQQQIQSSQQSKNSNKLFLGINHISIDSNSSSSDNSCTSTEGTILSVPEREQIENFFAGLGTNIYVSSSLANLYEVSSNKDDWNLLYTGIPVILHDTGSARSRSTPRVQFCFAERGSCFALWHDTINHLSQYRKAGPSFHTMCLSSDHRKIIGFSFDSSDSAQELWRHIEKLTNDPENISLNIPGAKKKKKQQKKFKPIPLPPKSQISNPCQFQHITSVTRDDTERYYSLQALVVSQSNGKCDEECKI